jgi:hypothetical protein
MQADAGDDRVGLPYPLALHVGNFIGRKSRIGKKRRKRQPADDRSFGLHYFLHAFLLVTLTARWAATKNTLPRGSA